MPGECSEREITPVQGDFHLSGRGIDVLQPVDNGSDRRRAGLGERDVTTGDRPSRVLEPEAPPEAPLK
jgi:hypothetical protein